MALIISNRRDAGYTIISRLEFHARKFIENTYLTNSNNPLDEIPIGIIAKINDKNPNIEWNDVSDALDFLDFPDIKEIILYKNHYTYIINKITKKDFIEFMDELYLLRCKIAHVKGYFTSIDLDKLFELSEKIADVLNLTDFQELLAKIKTSPKEVVIKIPDEFVEDQLEKSGIIHNLPIPDYEYEGGFVGREEDKKKILQLLNSTKFPVVTISGAGGVGKTALALKAIYDLTENSEKCDFDAIVWLSAKENKLSILGIEEIEPTLKSYDELLDTIINLFGFSDELSSNTTDEKEVLANKIFEITSKIIIVVDNLETISDQRIINFILEAPEKIKFLITSRKGIGQVERRQDLKELKPKEAITLFRQIARDKQQTKLAALPDEIVKKYVEKVSCYPLAIKWVIGQVARGKNINKIIDSIHNAESDISKFCFEQIFNSLSDDCKKILYAISLAEAPPVESILQYVTEIDEASFEDSIEELILVSLVIPEQFQNERKEISTKFSLLPLTTGYTRLQLNKDIPLREYLKNRINQIAGTINTSEKLKKEYKYSLYNFGAISDEEKIATIAAQTAFQKYQNGFYEQATEDYKRAVKIAPNFSSIYRNWAVMESYENHIQEADVLMAKAADLNPNDPQIFLLWGNIFRKSYKIHEAYDKYKKAYELAPNDPIILNAYGQANSRLGYYEEADKLLRQAIKPDSEFSSMKHEIINRTSIARNLIWWGEALIRDKNIDEAGNKFSTAIIECKLSIQNKAADASVFATLASAQLEYGIFLKNKGMIKEAFDIFKEIANSKSDSEKHTLHQLNALVEACEINLVRSKIAYATVAFKRLMKLLPTSSLIKMPKYIALSNRIKDLEFQLSPETKKYGTIKIVNRERNFIIIKEYESDKTYVGLTRSFLFKNVVIDETLTTRKVVFNLSKYIDDGVEKEGAVNIRLADD